MSTKKQAKPVETDVMVQNEGSVMLFHLLTPEAHAFVNDNVPEDAQYFGNSLVVEPRYALDLANGMQSAGLAVR